MEAQEGKPGNLALGIAYVLLHILWGLEDKLDDLERGILQIYFLWFLGYLLNFNFSSLVCKQQSRHLSVSARLKQPWIWAFGSPLLVQIGTGLRFPRAAFSPTDNWKNRSRVSGYEATNVDR